MADTKHTGAKRADTGRNLGPKPRHRGSFRRVEHYVVVDLVLPTGAVVAGCTMPDGTAVDDFPVAPPLRSNGQAKKALHRARRKWPNAHLIRCTWTRPGYALRGTLRAPEGTAGGRWRGMQQDGTVSVVDLTPEIQFGTSLNAAEIEGATHG